MPQQIHPATFTFEQFAADLRSEELWRGSRKVRCQRQPFRILCTLLEHAGEVVSREDLQRAIWGDQSPSDADHSLGIAINKLREALGDSAESPRFIETLSRRGYRFIAPVSISPEVDTASAPVINAAPVLPDNPGPEAPAATLQAPALALSATRPFARGRLRRAIIFWAVCLAVATVAGFFLAKLTGPQSSPRRIEQLTHNDSLFPGVPSMESFPVLASDGNNVYSAILNNGQTELASINPADGEMQQLHLPSNLANPTLSDISPDGRRLLVRSHASSDSEQPVWVVPRSGESALRVGNILAQDAIWMPDGQGILYAVGNDLNVIHLEDESISHFAELPGRAFWMRWSPNGKLLRLTLLNPLSHTSALWQMAPGGRPVELLNGWSVPESECCGDWTSDGRFYVFQSSRGGTSDLWKISGDHTSHPQRLTNGPLHFTAPAAERGTDRIYFVGLDVRSELQRFDAGLRRFIVERGFLADASRVSYSNDREWVAWTDSTGGKLWRARASDGSERVQLTPDNLQVFLARWSPDGHRLVAMAREPGHAWQLVLLNGDGGRNGFSMRIATRPTRAGPAMGGRSFLDGFQT